MDAEHRRAQRAVTALPPAVVVRLHPSTPSLGMQLWWQSTSFAPRRCGFDSRRLHLCLRSVNGKHAPFVRPRCGFNSCRRLLSRGRSSTGRAPGRHPGGRPFDPGRPLPVGLWCNSSMASSNLAGPGATPGGPVLDRRRGPKWLGYLLAERRKPCGSNPRPDHTSRPRRFFTGCGPEQNGSLGERPRKRAGSRGFDPRPADLVDR